MSRVGRSQCPLNKAVEILGDRWSLLILRDLIFGEQRGFNELLQLSREHLNPKVLTHRLRYLLSVGLIRTRADHSDQRRHGVYSLSEAGISLVPAIVHLATWAEHHFPVSSAETVRFRLLANGGVEMQSAFMKAPPCVAPYR